MRGIWGFEFGLTTTCFPSLGLGCKYKLMVILRQHYCITLATSLPRYVLEYWAELQQFI